MASNDVKVTLRIFSEKLTCSELSTVMMLQPTNCYEKGSAVSKNSSSVRAELLWVYSPEYDGGLEEQIELLADMLVNVEFLTTIKDEIMIEFFCSVSSENGQGNIFLSKSIITKLSKLEVELSTDYYLAE